MNPPNSWDDAGYDAEAKSGYNSNFFELITSIMNILLHIVPKGIQIALYKIYGSMIVHILFNSILLTLVWTDGIGFGNGGLPIENMGNCSVNLIPLEPYALP